LSAALFDLAAAEISLTMPTEPPPGFFSTTNLPTVARG
jgi:hypothetical protein